FNDAIEIDLIVRIEVHVEVVGPQLHAVAGRRTRQQSNIDPDVHTGRERLHAASARLRNRRGELPLHYDVAAVGRDLKLQRVETPARIRERGVERSWIGDREPLFLEL